MIDAPVAQQPTHGPVRVIALRGWRNGYFAYRPDRDCWTEQLRCMGSGTWWLELDPIQRRVYGLGWRRGFEAARRKVAEKTGS